MLPRDRPSVETWDAGKTTRRSASSERCGQELYRTARRKTEDGRFLSAAQSQPCLSTTIPSENKLKTCNQGAWGILVFLLSQQLTASQGRMDAGRRQSTRDNERNKLALQRRAHTHTHWTVQMRLDDEESPRSRDEQ